MKAGAFEKDQRDKWIQRIEKTFDAQSEHIFTILHGIYCDPDSGRKAQNNALAICKKLAESFSLKTRSALIDQHQEYKEKGQDERLSASSLFFQKIELPSLLGETEVHGAITEACQRVLNVHRSFFNFYNETYYAEQLASLSDKNPVPETAQAVFVETVITCGIGNGYEVSEAGMPHYRKMVRSFSPAEIKIMFQLAKGDGTVAMRLKHYDLCNAEFRSLVKELDTNSVPMPFKADYQKWSS